MITYEIQMIVVDTPKIIQEYLDGLQCTNPLTLDFEYFSKHEHSETLTSTIENNFEVFKRDLIYNLSESTEVIVTNHPVNVRISSIYQRSIGKLVTFDCVIRKSSEIKQEISKCRFQCQTCGALTDKVPLSSFDMRAPIGLCCPTNESHKRLSPKVEGATFEDTRYVTAQENQGVHGRQPRAILCYLKGSLVDSVQAGMRCKLTGIVKVLQVNDKDRRMDLYVEVYGITKDEDDYTDIEISEEDVRVIKGLAGLEDVYFRLAESISPTVYGYQAIKLAIVLQMFGGTTVNTGSTYLRGSSHILLCGDPGLAKSQIIRAVSKLVPRSVYTSGKSSSAAGLTAAAVKDDTDGRWVLEAGALVLADGGMCIVDELDKMTDEDRSALHEAMESQTISVNKAGISAQLNTRCSLLAAANPKMGKFIPGVDIATQVNLPPALLSRFDLIFLMIDVPDEKMDTYVARFVLNVRRQGELAMSGNSPDEPLEEVYNKPIDEVLFRKYISYARQLNPILTQEVMQYLTKRYVSMRKDSESLSTTVRQLEALVRLCESSARVRLSSEINMEDAERALSLYDVAKKSISLNTNTDTSNFERKPSIGEQKTIAYVVKILTDNLEMEGDQLIDILVNDLRKEPSVIKGTLFGMMDSGFLIADKSNGKTMISLNNR